MATLKTWPKYTSKKLNKIIFIHSTELKTPHSICGHPFPASVCLKRGWGMNCWLQTEPVNTAWKKRFFFWFFFKDVHRLSDLSREEKVRQGETASQILSAVFADKNEVQSLGWKWLTHLCYLWDSQSLNRLSEQVKKKQKHTNNQKSNCFLITSYPTHPEKVRFKVHMFFSSQKLLL